MKEVFLAVLGWMAFAVLTTVVATTKGKSRLMWAGIGWLLGPIGLILAVLMPDKRVCPTCKKRVSRRVVFCPFCRKPIY